MGLREVKKELHQLEKEELIHHIAEVYKKYKDVKVYFDFYVNPDLDSLLDVYKSRVHEGFYPQRGWRLKLYRSRKAINEFKKLGISNEAEADLLLYFTEVAVGYARKKNVKTESFYLRLVKSFEKALEHIVRFQLEKTFHERIETLISRTEGLPWGCHNELRQTLKQHIIV